MKMKRRRRPRPKPKPKAKRSSAARVAKHNDLSAAGIGFVTVMVNLRAFSRTMVREMITDKEIKQLHEFTLNSLAERKQTIVNRVHRLILEYQEDAIAGSYPQLDDIPWN